MVIRKLKSPRISETALNYNETKVAAGTADILSVSGMPDGRAETIYGTFERLEDLSKMRPNAGKLGYHITINPDIGEEMTDEMARELARDLLRSIGLGEQPWALYKHHDIDRVHYHIVSTRARANGTVIDLPFDKIRIRETMEELQPKYGFAIGRNPNIERLERFESRFSARAGNITRQFEHFFGMALDYNYTSIAEFKKIMKSYGVQVKTLDGSRPPRLGFAGMNFRGKVCTNFDSTLDHDGIYYRSIMENPIKPKFTVTKMHGVEALVAELLASSKSKYEFQKTVQKAGISVDFDWDKNGEVKRVTIMDHVDRGVFTDKDFDGELSLDAINDKLANGWADAGADDIYTAIGDEEDQASMLEEILFGGFMPSTNASRDEAERKRKEKMKKKGLQI